MNFDAISRSLIFAKTFNFAKVLRENKYFAKIFKKKIFPWKSAKVFHRNIFSKNVYVPHVDENFTFCLRKLFVEIFAEIIVIFFVISHYLASKIFPDGEHFRFSPSFQYTFVSFWYRYKFRKIVLSSYSTFT